MKLRITIWDNPARSALDWCKAILADNPALVDEQAILIDGTLLARLVTDRELFEFEYDHIWTVQGLLVTLPDYAEQLLVIPGKHLAGIVADLDEIGSPAYRQPTLRRSVRKLVQVLWPEMEANAFDENVPLLRGVRSCG